MNEYEQDLILGLFEKLVQIEKNLSLIADRNDDITNELYRIAEALERWNNATLQDNRAYINSVS